MTHRFVARVAGGITATLAIFVCSQAETVDSQVTRIGDHLRFAGDSVSLKTTSDGRHAFVTGHFGDKGPFNIIVDTGAGANVIDRALAEEMGLQKVGEEEVLSGGVEPVKTDIVVVPHLSVDGLSVEDAEFITIDLAAMSRGQFHGVLGMGLFREALITFDPRNERITVSNGNLAADAPGAIPFDSALQSSFLIHVNAAGHPIPMMFDTGAPFGFTFPLAMSETLPLQGALTQGPPAKLAGGGRSIWLAALNGDIQLGDLVYQNPQVTFIDPSAPHGTIGNAILGELTLSIDQRNGLLALRRPEAAEVTNIVAAEETGIPRRLGIRLEGLAGGALTVSWVEPGSLGEKNGFTTGDKLVSLNGRPAQGYDMKELGTLFGGTAILSFDVDRDGERRTIEIR